MLFHSNQVRRTNIFIIIFFVVVVERNDFRITQNLQNYRPAITVFGIETSCDDTACAVVNSHREVLGEASHSQLQFHLRFVFMRPFNLHSVEVNAFYEREINF